MTRRLRHRLGRWLLRDSTQSVVPFRIIGRDPSADEMLRNIDGAAIHAALVKHKRERGGGSLGLS